MLPVKLGIPWGKTWPCNLSCPLKPPPIEYIGLSSPFWYPPASERLQMMKNASCPFRKLALQSTVLSTELTTFYPNYVIKIHNKWNALLLWCIFFLCSCSFIFDDFFHLSGLVPPWFAITASSISTVPPNFHFVLSTRDLFDNTAASSVLAC